MLQRLSLFLLSLTTLFTFALLEKGMFALHYSELQQKLGPLELLYTLLWGFRFDLAISAIFALLAFLAAQLLALLTRRGFAATLRWTTFLATAALILLHGADTLYYGEAGRHLGYELTEGLNSGAALASAAITTYLLPVAGQLLVILFAWFCTGWLFKRFSHPPAETLRQRLAAGAMTLPLLLLSVMMVRGGTQSVPLEPLHAQRIGDPQQATLALNGAYNALFSSVTPYSVNPLFSTPPSEQQLALLRQLYRSAPVPEIAGSPRQQNVVLILLESWSGAYMAPYGSDIVTTPNFDQLRTQGLSTRVMMAAGSRTTEGMFATFCSTQNPLGQTVAQSQLQNYNYDCLPEILRDAGWHTAFFQSSNKETSGTGSFAQLLGFKQSFGKREMSREKQQYAQNSWGYQDPDLYRFTLEKMRRMPQPFLVGINTNSTHDSQLPEGIVPLGPTDNQAGRYRNILHFADAALGEFISAVRNTPELKDTIFVLVADHSGPTPPQPLQQHLLPFAILAPQIAPQMLDEIASQRDIAPTLLQLLNLTIPSHFTGSSLLQAGSPPPFSDYYHQGILGWIEGEQGLEFPINEPQQQKCFSLARQLNSKQTHPCGDEAMAMQQRALAFTHTSQSLLFSGELKRFAELR